MPQTSITFSSPVKAAMLAMCMALLSFSPVFAQLPAAPPSTSPSSLSRIETQARAADAVTLVAGSSRIQLWGVEPVESQGPVFRLKARTALDNAVGQGKIVCEVKSRDAERISAQCVNSKDQDLSLFMLQQGFATADRSAVYGTVFEDAYIQAEAQAQSRNTGIWGENTAAPAQNDSGGTFMYGFGFVLLLCIIGAFAALSIIVIRGFQKVIDAQNQNVEMVSRERDLRDKERAIVAVMLDSELKANKAKIEAYKAVYEEMLRGLKDPDRSPKYKKSGDIIQKQPALERSVFVRNTDKLDMLGGRLSSALVHFYARVKSNPEYITLEPQTPLDDAIALLEKALAKAERLNDLADDLLEAFSNSGIVSEDYQE